MKTLRRAAWALLHLAFSVFALLVLVATRRRAAGVFTHFQDIDASGRDAQMGPLVEAMLRERRPFFEISLVPLSAALFRNWRGKRRLFVSHAAILGPARAWHALTGRDLAEARVAVAALILRALRPSTLFLIDESGSGQPLVRAARRLGIRTVGIQHGGFLGGNPQYEPTRNAAWRVEPVDHFCVWSEWFRDRLFEVSPIYDEENTVVTGRMRWPRAADPHPLDGLRRVLVVEEGDERWASRFEEAVGTIASLPGHCVSIRPHPARSRGVGRVPPLAEALAACDVVVGVRSTALLEAVAASKPVIVIAPDDPIGLTYVREGFAVGCGSMPELPARIAFACGPQRRETVAAARARLWGGAPKDPVRAILARGAP